MCSQPFYFHGPRVWLLISIEPEFSETDFSQLCPHLLHWLHFTGLRA